VKYLLSLLLLGLLSAPSVVLGVVDSELIERGGLYYKKSTNVPFAGTTSGRIQATYENGKKVLSQ
jgi:hypothetical protein